MSLTHHRIYPDASWEKLKAMAMLTLTLFIFDDAIDKEIEADTSDYASNFSAANKLREECLAFAHYHLGFGSKRDRHNVPAEFAPFAEVAPSLVTAPDGQVNLTKMANDIEKMIAASAKEQAQRLSGRLSTVDEYWAFRNDVGAVFIFCNLHQFVADVNLPPALAWSQEVDIMRYECSAQPIM
jgi:hypothetical protein